MSENVKPKKDEKKSLSRAKVETEVKKRNERIMTPSKIKFMKQTGVVK